MVRSRNIRRSLKALQKKNGIQSVDLTPIKAASIHSRLGSSTLFESKMAQSSSQSWCEKLGIHSKLRKRIMRLADNENSNFNDMLTTLLTTGLKHHPKEKLYQNAYRRFLLELKSFRTNETRQNG